MSCNDRSSRNKSQNKCESNQNRKRSSSSAQLVITIALRILNGNDVFTTPILTATKRKHA